MRWEFIRLYDRTKENFSKAFEDLFYDLKSAIYEFFVQIPKECAWFVQKLWLYKGILWTDRNWDHAYILRMLQFKLKQVRLNTLNNGHHVNFIRDVKNIQKAEDLIQAILDNNHDKHLTDAHDAKWGELGHATIKIPGSNSSEWRSLRLKARTPEEQKQETKEYRILIRKSIKLENKAWERLWKHLHRHCREWWD